MTKGRCLRPSRRANTFSRCWAVSVDGLIIALRTNPVSVPPVKSIKLVADAPRPISLVSDDDEVALCQASVRSAGATDKARWQWPSKDVVGRVVLFPQKTVRLNLVGKLGSRYFATAIRIPPHPVIACSFRVERQVPCLRCVLRRYAASSLARLMLLVILLRSWAVIVLKQEARGTISGYSMGDSLGS